MSVILLYIFSAWDIILEMNLYSKLQQTVFLIMLPAPPQTPGDF